MKKKAAITSSALLLFFIIWLGMVPVDYNYKNQIMKLVSIEEKQ